MWQLLLLLVIVPILGLLLIVTGVVLRLRERRAGRPWGAIGSTSLLWGVALLAVPWIFVLAPQLLLVTLLTFEVLGLLLLTVGVALRLCELRARKPWGALGSIRSLVLGVGVLCVPLACSLALRLLA